MKAVIMAGGKGTRVASIANDIPKPMIPICEKPILEHQIDVLKRQNITDITIVIGYFGRIIREYFKDGTKMGVQISYIEEKTPLGTAGALYYLKDKIKEDFLLLNGDIIFDIDIERFMKYHRQKRGIVTIFTHPNSHPYDSGLIQADSSGIVINWLNKEDKRLYYKNRVNAGIHILSPQVFFMFSEERKVDLDREILKTLIPEKKLIAYDSPEYVKDMGTPDRYQSVTQDVKRGIVSAKNLRNPQKAIFLDRDGTINVWKNFLKNPEEMELIQGVAEAIRWINQSEYLAIVVTNQPVIARGECTVEKLEQIHQKMETLLGEQGAYIDDLFYCPHHPERGFKGERLEYKIECECRKPKPGLLIKAAKKYHIDLSKSFLVGDEERDVMAGKNAGCRVYRIEKGKNLKEIIEELFKGLKKQENI